MASDANMPGFFTRLFSSSDEPLDDAPPPRWTPTDFMDDDDRELAIFLSMSIFGVFILSGGVIFIFEACRYVVVGVCSWVYERTPWGKAFELEQQNKALELERRKELEQREKALELERRKRAIELERREKDIDRELKEASNARQARARALDLEIGVCNGLLEMLKRSVASTEDRAAELETEKELLYQEGLREEREALDKKMVMRRVPKTDAQ
ncbi:hypothetical protein FB446DRAFT_709673 [Lentinula raphanica]|nr:hypothetical protein FB446DRAFT_709673 [Lentinula raphanica]